MAISGESVQLKGKDKMSHLNGLKHSTRDYYCVRKSVCVCVTCRLSRGGIRGTIMIPTHFVIRAASELEREINILSSLIELNKSW